MHVVVAGGGTAGHIEPALNLADALVAHDPSITVSAIGTSKGLETTLVPARGYELDIVEPIPMPRTINGQLVTLPARVRSSVRSARDVLERRQADVVVGFGGYVALSAYLAARKRVPIVVHEANAKAGLANRIGAKFTTYVAETVPGSLPGASVVGLPLRPVIAHLDRPAERAAAREFFGLPSEQPVLFVFGGSQGARRVNDTIVAAAAELSESGVAVLHAVGRKNADQRPVPAPAGFVTVDYVDRMDLAYAAADLALCRAGAMTVAELSAVGLPAVYVPLPVGNGEQRRNAAGVIDAGGGVAIADEDLNVTTLLDIVVPLISNSNTIETMSRAATAQGTRGATEKLVQMTLSAAAAGGSNVQQ